MEMHVEFVLEVLEVWRVGVSHTEVRNCAYVRYG